MRKKLLIVSIIMIVVATAIIFTGCSAKSASIYRKTYENISCANANYYVVFEDGKYIAYESNKHKKIIDKSYDTITLLDDEEGCITYFLVGNIGDVGKTLLNSSGDVVMESTTEKKIIDVNILSSSNNGNNSLSKTANALVIKYLNSSNQEKKVLCDVTGKQIIDEIDVVNEIKVVDGTTENIVYFCTEKMDNNDEIVEINVFNNKFESMFSKTFATENNVIYNFDNVNNTLEISYNDAEITRYVLFTPYDIHSGYTQRLGMKLKVNEESLSETFYLYKKENGLCNLISDKKEGNLLTFVADDYSIEPKLLGDIIELTDKNDIKKAYDYDGNIILSGYDTYSSNYNYFKVSNEDNNIVYYDITGKEIYVDTFKDTVIFNGLASNRYLIKVLSNGETTYNFYNYNTLVKSYSTKDGFSYNNKDNKARYIFDKETNYKYSYNYILNKEIISQYDENGIDKSKTVGNGVYSCSYEEGKTQLLIKREYSPYPNINIAIESEIEPFVDNNGLIPSYYDASLVNDLQINQLSSYFAISNNKATDYINIYHISFSLYKEGTPSIDSGLDYNAYYICDGKGGVIELAKGYTNFNFNFKIYDNDENGNNSIIYLLSNEINGIDITYYQKPRTVIFELNYDETGEIIYNEKAVIEKANASFTYDKITTKNIVDDSLIGIYDYNGKQLLDEIYRVVDFDETLAVVASTKDPNTYGLFDFEKGKLKEKCIYSQINLYHNGFYSIRKIEDYNYVYTLKTVKGKKLADDVLSITQLNNPKYNNNENRLENVYSIQTQKGYKLLTAYYKDEYWD